MMCCLLFTQLLWIHVHRHDSVRLFPPLISLYFSLGNYNNKNFNYFQKIKCVKIKIQVEI